MITGKIAIIIVTVIFYALAAVLTAQKAYKSGLPSAKYEHTERKWRIQTIIAGVVFPVTWITVLIYIILCATHRKEW